MLNRSDIRSDPGTGQVEPGLLLRVGLNVSEINNGVCEPLPGVYVDVWHCNALGIYSDVAQQGTQGKKFLRGYQVTDAHGNVRFLTVYPGYYPGRTAHIHFRVRKFVNGNVTFNFVSQLYFDDTVTDGIYGRVDPYRNRPPRNTRNSNDGIFNAVMLMRLADNNTHSIASFNIKVNSIPGIVDANATPPDPHAAEHANDFGGGSPPPPLVFADVPPAVAIVARA
jgi:protocatechuate 3,4-dioxygenase beta subunit